MKAPPLGYVRAASLADVFRLQREAGGAHRLLAGGQSLLAALSFRLMDPCLLIDITRVAELSGITFASPVLRIGALTTHADLAAHPLVRTHVPLLAEASPLIAHPAIRNRGTIGGALAYADPAAELPACCVALDAAIVLAGPGGQERRVRAQDFFTGLFTTAMSDGELISAIEIPAAGPRDHSIILELARRRGDYAMAGIAIQNRVFAKRRDTPHVVYFGVGSTPVLANHASAALGAGPWSQSAVEVALEALDRDLDPPGDANGSPEMKRHLARVLLRRALAGLEARATKQAA